MTMSHTRTMKEKTLTRMIDQHDTTLAEMVELDRHGDILA